MTRRQNAPMPSVPFGLLLVEGGDEMAVCKVLAGAAWTGLCCWKAEGREFANLARLAKLDPNFRSARSIGIVLDVEDDRALATCVDQLVTCAGIPHSASSNARAREDKGWLRAYLGMTSAPELRFYQAFDHPQGIDASHPVFAPLQAFVQAL